MKNIRIEHNKKMLVFIIKIISVVFLAFFLFNTLYLNKEETGFCRVDNDCVKQQVTCCSCNMGGREECMAKKEAKEWKDRLSKNCGEVLCTALYACKNTECKCINGNCTEVPKN